MWNMTFEESLRRWSPESYRIIVSARKEIESLRADAMRYRWLRDTDHWSIHKAPTPDFSGTVIRGVRCCGYYKGSAAMPDWLTGKDLDDAIDSAITVRDEP